MPYIFFFHQSRFIFRAAAMSGATILLRNDYFLKKYIEIIFFNFFLYYHIKIIPKHQKNINLNERKKIKKIQFFKIFFKGKHRHALIRKFNPTLNEKQLSSPNFCIV